jgi:23S rRNA (uridine2552-2'-O)-methyltransferase
MDPIVGAVSLVGDLADPVVMDAVVGALGGAPADLIVSDMAPDLTGIREADQARHAALVHLALEVAARALKRGGMCVFKVFYGSMFESLLKEIKPCFNSVGIRKPKASRAESREVYWVLKGYTGYILT